MYEKKITQILSNTAEVEETSLGTSESVGDSEDTEILLERILEQLHYMDENDTARIDALEEKLSNIENTLSQNSIVAEEDVSSSAGPETPSVSANDIKQLVHGLADLTAETVSQNDLANESIMTKHIEKYNTVESLFFVMTLCVFGLFILHLLKK